MRLSIITNPGEKYGPCDSCHHDECMELREIAITTCHLCSQAVGFKRPYCYDADRRPVHFSCFASEVDKQAVLLGVRTEEIPAPCAPAPFTFDKATAAKLLNISESTINELMAAGELSRVKIGTRVVFTPAMLTDLIKRKSIEARPRPKRLRVVS